MKLEVGMFYRYKGQIGKYKKITELDRHPSFTNNYLRESEIILLNNAKFNYNIIDILEVGDYANGYYVSKIWEKDEITHYVNETPIKRKEREIVIQAPSYGGIEILKNKNIKSVITHEQMEQMAYKVVE